ncbi:MAG: DEAD/DEAH box helicase, partial [Acholeplasma sp.]|nr:DEAD/DEAH box helicase [Acholeplasma sp.]
LRYLFEKYSKKSGYKIDSLNALQNYILKQASSSEYYEPKEGIVDKYKSIFLSDLGEFEYEIDDWSISINSINEDIKSKINNKIDEIRNESISIKNILRKISIFFTEESYNKLLDSSKMMSVPNWDIQLYSSVEEFDKYKEIVVQLVNNTDKIAQPGSYETAIFNGGLIVRCDLGFVQFDFSAVKHYYHDKPTMAAVGNNCTIKFNKNALETENIPIYEQKRVITIDKYNSYVEFDKLIKSPIDNLYFIHGEMLKSLRIHELDYENSKTKFDSEYLDKFSEEIMDFKFEINRFKNGIELIKNKSDVRKSFDLMNKTFSLNKKYVGWRMFQIVFIVSELADIINSEYQGTPGFACNDINIVDLIYFPTGGGKTETFLGCVVFAAFFDRIRGKENGATSIIKYPLRLLAAQQLDRVLSLTINANLIKHENSILGDDFSVGFYTGSKNTPNRIDKIKALEIVNLSQESRDQLYRQIDLCPKCKALGKQVEMHVDLNLEKWTLQHKCSNSDCNYIPPIYIVDDEIYRYAPTFIISTIDKMANIGTSMGFKSLLGQSNNRCIKHGFTTFGNKCGVPDCKCDVESNIERKDPVPTLSIQDEMHLVNESLGTFDSHYESLIQYYCSSLVPKNQRKSIKFIGATATISDYKKHIKGLYNKDAKKFPTTVKKENFYSIIDEGDISRIIIGAALYGGSITDRIQSLVTLIRIIISNWISNAFDKVQLVKLKGFIGDSENLISILHFYLIAIIYNNSKNDAGTLRAIIENQGSNTLASENLRDFDIAEITGDIEFKTIKNVIHNIESNKNKYETKNIIIATSAISHGVDEECFNQIFFFGMPNQTSEYIQAYSRVGRTYTGLVFDIFRIVRDRDKSYLKNFYNFHEYSDLLIEPVPINRYAKNAIYSTLPGIISALIYQHYVQKYRAIDVTKAILEGRLTLEMIVNDIKNIYECDSQDSKLYEQIIENEVAMYFYGFENNTSSELSVSDMIKKINPRHKGPMTNLRDVDIPLEVYMKGE